MRWYCSYFLVENWVIQQLKERQSEKEQEEVDWMAFDKPDIIEVVIEG